MVSRVALFAAVAMVMGGGALAASEAGDPVPPVPAVGHAIAAENAAEVDWVQLLMGLFGGIAIFLFGMKTLSKSLKEAFGDSLRTVLAKFCRNRFTGFVSGALATAVLSSSTAASVLVVQFVEAGHMSFQAALGVCLGVNVGSTLTAHLVAFKVTKYALMLVAGGYFTTMFTSSRQVALYGETVFGLGLLFYGLDIMGSTMKPLQTHPAFIEGLASMQSPVTGTIVSTLFTLVVQASAATAGIAIVLAQQGLIPLQAGMAMILGANVGTCGTSLLSAVGKQRDTMRIAVAYLMFKVVGVAMWLPVFGLAERGILALTPSGDTATAIANTHTAFNVFIALVFLPIIAPVARFMYVLVPASPAAPGKHPKRQKE